LFDDATTFFNSLLEKRTFANFAERPKSGCTATFLKAAARRRFRPRPVDWVFEKQTFNALVQRREVCDASAGRLVGHFALVAILLVAPYLDALLEHEV
jgi:hypothetical protein